MTVQLSLRQTGLEYNRLFECIELPGYRTELNIRHLFCCSIMYRLLKELSKKIFAASNAQRVGREQISSTSHTRNQGNIQDIGVVDIDPEKLMTKLRGRFGSEFQVHVGLWHFTERLRFANPDGCR
jgi:hypothetical protein